MLQCPHDDFKADPIDVSYCNACAYGSHVLFRGKGMNRGKDTIRGGSWGMGEKGGEFGVDEVRRGDG